MLRGLDRQPQSEGAQSPMGTPWEAGRSPESLAHDCLSLTAPPCPCSQQGSDEGQLILGGVDESLYTGDIYWTPVTQELYWQIGIEG